MGYFDLHRHTEFSSFDGFGKSSELAIIAKNLGQTALGISDHGNTHGLVKHWQECLKNDIKPILGVESYFMPKYQEKHRGWHLCMFAKNIAGYENLNRVQTLGDARKYYNPIILFDDIAENHDGLIISTACVGSFWGDAVKHKRTDAAVRLLSMFKELLGDDFYVEIQPYTISVNGLQEYVNTTMERIAKELGIRCILTSDSHRGLRDDFPSYLKLHEIAGHDLEDITKTYKHRYMPSESEIIQRYVKMHGNKVLAEEYVENIGILEASVDKDILGQLSLGMPEFDKEKSSKELLRSMAVKGLKEKGKWNEEYKARLKCEMEIIEYHGFSDYFLMVRDYTTYAKTHGIAVGPGRGSACNCLVSWAVGVTDVDPIKFGLDYHRFIRKDKKKMPDIDLDFQTSRREEVIEYLVGKYKDNSAQIVSYGLYKPDNLINDLAKVCGLNSTGDIPDEIKQDRKQKIDEIKQYLHQFTNDQAGTIDTETLFKNKKTADYNSNYDDIITHYTKLFRKVRYVGTHAAGVAVVSSNILQYSALKTKDDKGRNKRYIAYDLVDAESINIMKFDILGLNTMESLSQLRELSGNPPDVDVMLSDDEIWNRFRIGDTDGIFQLESPTAKAILQSIKPDNFDDLSACSSINRPGPLSLKTHEKYAENKEKAKQGLITFDGPYTRFLKDTYGTMIYQEQVQLIATEVGGMKWEDADKIIKLGSGGAKTTAAIQYQKQLKAYEEEFCKNAKKFGIGREEGGHLFNEFFNYSFNKGHSTGYSLISLEEMWHKVHHPLEFWTVKIKNAGREDQVRTFLERAVVDGCVILLPNVNYSKFYSIRYIEGEPGLQQGYRGIKNVGDKASEYISEERQKNGPFHSIEEFTERCKSRCVTSRVISALLENGALDFDKKNYIQRVKQYNRTLYMKALNSRGNN